MPTISDLKDQARALEQQGQIDKALTVYQHILKHLEGNPAITKVLPLYVKAGDLLLKLDRTDEAVASYEKGAEHYAATGAAPRVIALCEKILRLFPERNDVYTNFVRLLIEHGHAGSARDVLAAYAQQANMDRALETLDDLAGRPNSEVQPMLERLLESFELEEQDDEAAERVSTHLEQVTDDLAGELTGVPEEADAEGEEGEEEEKDGEEEDEEKRSYEESVDEGVVDEAEEEAAQEEDLSDSEPLTPHMLDLDRMPRISSIQRAITDDDLDVAEEEGPEVEEEDEEEEAPVFEQSPESDITTNLTPTAETPHVESESDEAATSEEPVEDSLELILSESMTAESVEAAEGAGDTESGVEIERSDWTPDFAEPSVEEAVAAKWSPEEDLTPAAKYPSEEYEMPDGTEDELEEEEGVAVEPPSTDTLDDEIARAVEESEAFAQAASEPDQAEEVEAAAAPIVEDTTPPALEAEPEPERAPRPSRPPRMMVPAESETKSKSPVLFGVAGFVVGLVVGVITTLILFGGGSGGSPAAIPADQQGVSQTAAAETETPAATEPDVIEPAQSTPEPAAADTTGVQTPEESPTDTTEAAQVEGFVDTTLQTEVEAAPLDTTVADAPIEQAAEIVASEDNPIVVEGLEIDEFSEVESDGRPGFRVVHVLDWADPLVIEAYRDTSVTMSTFIQVNVTPPDTVVGIRRMDGFMVYASGVMPEDSLRSLMARLVVGERPPN